MQAIRCKECNKALVEAEGTCDETVSPVPVSPKTL